MDDLISRREAIDVIDKIFPADPMRNDYTQGITCGAALATEYIKQLPSAQPEHTGRWSGLWSEPQDDNSIYGEKLMEGDTIYLLGVEGVVKQECGAWGWASGKYVPWEKLEEKMPHGNRPDFSYCDNFVSFWELKWAFDDGYDWDGVPFIRHGARREDGE